MSKLKVPLRVFTTVKSVSKLLIIICIVGMSLGTYSCKSKKKVTNSTESVEAAKKRNAKTSLENLLTDSSKSLEEKEAELQRLKNMNIDDPEIQALIKKVEDKLSDERKRRAAEAEANKPENRLTNYFNQIANASSVGIANYQIKDALNMFSSPSTPVLILLGVFDGEKDYDKPTTAEKYLNYLKDVKKNPNTIENIVFDENGKIKELELKKK